MVLAPLLCFVAFLAVVVVMMIWIIKKRRDDRVERFLRNPRVTLEEEMEREALVRYII